MAIDQVALLAEGELVTGKELTISSTQIGPTARAFVVVAARIILRGSGRDGRKGRGGGGGGG
jgi:hypothetical protein